MNKGPNATICLVRRQNHAGTTVSWTTVQREKSSHAYKLSSNVQTACSTDSLNNCPKHSILRFSSFALKIYLWLKMCQHNLPCSIVYAHCLLPGRAFASLYVQLFLEKEAVIGGRAIMREKSVPRIAVWHHEACRVMTNGDPRDGFFYPTFTRIMDSFSCSPLLKKKISFQYVHTLRFNFTWWRYLNITMTSLGDNVHRYQYHQCIKPSLDCLWMIAWLRDDFLSQGKLSDIHIWCARNYFLIHQFKYMLRN